MRYAAFLRAVNLGKNRRVTSERLRSLFEELGAEDVATFRTSGNVVFEAPRNMVRDLEKHLERELGHEIVIFMRTASEVKEIAVATGEDRLSFGKRELYWLPSGGYAASALDRNALDMIIGPTTVRTKG